MKDYLGELYNNEEMSITDISGLIGSSRTTTWRLLKLYGVKIRPRGFLTEAQRKKLGKTQKQRWINGVYANRKGTGFRGGYIPWNKGKKCPNISKTMKERGIKPKVRFVAKGKDHPNYSKSHSLRTKNKISKSVKGKLLGNKHWNWQNGISFEPYLPGFNSKLKDRIRKRNGYRCQECFRHQDELYTKSGRKYKLHVHHIDYDKKNNDKENLISLCRSCHLQTNYSRDDWIEYYRGVVSR